MNRIQGFVLSLALSGTAFAENQNIKINQTAFELKSVSNQDDDGYIRNDIELYRKGKKLLTHTLDAASGDCSITQIELGDYAVKDNQLIFYSYWAAADRQGIWTYPYGVRKQTYAVDAQGNVKLIDAVLYIEDVIGDPLSTNPDEEYLQFLHRFPKNRQQQRTLNDYIQTMQTQYRGRFVHGQERTLLIKEVKTQLAKHIARETQGWKQEFGRNVRM